MKISALIFLLAVSTFSAIHQEKKSSNSAAGPRARAAPTPAKSAAKASPKRSIDDTAEFEKANALTDPVERLAAVKKFLTSFPKSKHRDAADETIAKLRSDIGNAQLTAGDLVAAADTFKAAALDAPKPIPSQLFTETFAKFPTNLFFRGAQLEAYEIARILEERVDKNVDQLLAITSFYLSAELGADAKRLALAAIAIAPESSVAHQSAGLAHRMEFDLEASHTAFEKASLLDPNSIPAKRGLAEAKRSLGRSDEAVAFYRSILATDAANQGARDGLIFALFETDKRAEAEALLETALQSNPNNVVLLSSAAYWYASRKEGEKAAELARRAVAANPRFVWAHIALGRALMMQKKFVEADQVLLTARRYGNFPTVEYELAAARAGAGFFREAAEILEKNFTIVGDAVETTLGGRVKRKAADLIELISYERRASIFAFAAADDAETASRLLRLLEFRNAMSSDSGAAAAADKFVEGTDKMKVHRQLFAAGELLKRNIAISKALELVKSAAPIAADGLDVAEASAAVTAEELYGPRTLALADGRYLLPPSVPRTALSAILRGRIEELTGWAHLQMNESAEAVVRLQGAVALVPADSAWWRSANWRLGAALAAEGKNKEALEAYYKGYLGGSSDSIKYAVIESLYKRVHGNADLLVLKVGRNPIAARETPSGSTTSQIETGAAASISPTPQRSPVASVETTSTLPIPAPSPSPAASKPLFEPVVITIPDNRRVAESPKPCTLTLSEGTITLKPNGSEISIIVGSEGDADLTEMTATPSSTPDLEVRREAIAAIEGRALFVLKSVSASTGEYTVKFKAACGERELRVRIN